MNKKQGILLGIAFVLLFSGITLATPSAASDVIIYAFDQKPAVYESCTEWVTLHNPSTESVEIGNWTLDNAAGERETIPEGTTLYPGAYYVYYLPYQWLDNEDEAITLSDAKGNVVDETPLLSDTKDANRCWVRECEERKRNTFLYIDPKAATYLLKWDKGEIACCTKKEIIRNS